MELLVYGHAGRRLLVIAVDGIDWQSWTNRSLPVAERARRHEHYHRYPWMR